jgi:propanol-preferring alcohol dehydrogenase
VSLAPLLCAGLIGYRSLRLCGPVDTLGIYGFGAAAHILCQIAVHSGVKVVAFTRDGDKQAQAFAVKMGADWAGDSTSPSPEPLDAAIIFAPVGALVPLALKAVRKGGRVVCGGIHMSDIPGFAYADLWQERSILSVANLTRADGEAFFPLAEKAGVETETTPYTLEEANMALNDLRTGKLQGAAVLVP